jgi:hypothetical protein
MEKSLKEKLENSSFMTKEEEKILDEKLEKEFGSSLQELNLSWAGKLFFAGVAGWLGGTAYKGASQGFREPPKLPIKIKGTPKQIKAIQDAIYGSKAFQDAISQPNATIEQVIEKLKLRDVHKRSFERLTNKKWPL